ncbi:hypothetical protein ES703_121176 [subsurface metagenome]
MKMIFLNKADHTLEGVVYSADGKEDTQGDKILPEDCEILYDAAQDFQRRWASGERDLFNLNHNDQKILKGVELEECYITAEEEMREDVVIPECSWIIKLKLSEEAFDLVAGASGLSMQGVGHAEEA